jgi:hypothetical protein
MDFHLPAILTQTVGPRNRNIFYWYADAEISSFQDKITGQTIDYAKNQSDEYVVENETQAGAQ